MRMYGTPLFFSAPRAASFGKQSAWGRKRSMATAGKASECNPYAGKSHERFTEGEVASAAMSMRGALLYKNLSMLVVGGILATAMSLRAETETVGDYTWSYCINGDTAEIVKGVNPYFAAISPDPTGEVVIPSTLGGKPVTRIGNGAFKSCRKLKNVTIGNGVEGIDYEAFYDCSGLTNVTIGTGLFWVDNWAFKGCTSLKAVQISDLAAWSAINFGRDFGSNPLEYAEGLYLNGSLVTNLSMAAGTKEIGDCAFRGYTRLEGTLMIPHGVVQIGYDAFYGNKNISNVVIPDTVKSIESGAFGACNESIYSYDAREGVELKKVDGWVVGYRNLVIDELMVSGVRGVARSAIGDSLTSIVFSGDVPVIDGCSGCRKLTHVTILNGATAINSCAFDYCTNLTSVTIPSSVTSIGAYAFCGCSGLPSVTIPGSVMRIGGRAFAGCSGLTSVMIGNGVANIGSFAFSGCSRLTSMIIPDSVTNIEYGAFEDCSGLTSVTIPDSVTRIGSSAFSGCTNLASVVLPDSVTRIEYGAFRGCSGLTSVTIPDSVTSIGENAFYGCSGLTSVTIPDSVTNIEENAFYACSGLMSLTIGNGVTRIGKGAFDHCSGMTRVAVPASVYSCLRYAFYDCPNVTSLTAPFVPEYIDRRKLTDVTISDGTIFIDGWDYSFHTCTNLTSITIPNSVTYIGAYAFERCSRLTSVTIPDSVTYIGYDAFSGCSGLTSVTIPDSVTGIGGEAFWGCSGLTNVVIGNGLRDIWGRAFGSCHGLTSMMIPASVTNIAKEAFYGCGGLKSFVVADGNPQYKSINGIILNKDGTTLVQGVNGDVVIPDGVTDIGGVGHGAFQSLPNLTSVLIPNDVAIIHDFAFEGCRGLTNVTIGNGVTYICTCAFRNCSSLSNIVFKGNAPSIGSSPFEGVGSECTVYVRRNSTGWGVDIPGTWNGVKIDYTDNMPDYQPDVWTVTFDAQGGETTEASRSITNDCPVGKLPVVTRNGYEFAGWFTAEDGGAQVTAFTVITDDITFYAHWTGAYGVPTFIIEDGVLMEVELNGATEVSIPNGVTSIGDDVFSDCQDLTSVTIPDGVTSIGAYAFSGCIALTNVTIPNSVTSIGEGAFRSCYGLADAKGFVIVRHVLYGYVGNDSEVTIPDGVTSIDDGVFSDSWDLTNVTIPDGVTSIGAGAFEWCIALTNVTMSDSVTSIGDGAFQVCSLVSVTLSEGLMDIGADAFRGCSELTGLTLPDGVTSIGAGAFAGCRSLTDVVLPSSVTSIGEEAFSGNRLVEFVVDDDNPSYKAVSGLLLTKDGRTLVAAPGGLTNVTIPEGVVNIGAYGFDGYTYVGSLLKSVAIPNSVTNIGASAFSACPDLTNIVFKGNAPAIGEYAFAGVGSGCIVYVRRNSTGWGVTIPGTWNGLDIQYLMPEVEITVANATGTGTVEADGELPEVEVASGVTVVVKGENLDAAALAAKITPKPHEEGQSASLFKVKAEAVAGGVSLAVALDEEAVDPDATAAEIVAPESVAAFGAAANGESVSVSLSSAKQGLYYGIAAAGNLTGLDAAVENVLLVRAGESGVTIPVVKPAGGAAFFKVIVSDRAR